MLRMTTANVTRSPASILLRLLLIGDEARPLDTIEAEPRNPSLPGALNATGPTVADAKTPLGSSVATIPLVIFRSGSVSFTWTILSRMFDPALVEPSTARAWLVRNRPSANGWSPARTVKRRSIVVEEFAGSL